MHPNVPILVAEDDENDIFFLRLALERSGLRNPLITVRDGQEVENYLAGVGPYADRASHPLPGLLLIDLKMPKKGGFDVLAWIATRSDFKELPVVVLSSSSQDSDVQKARDLGAADYHVKPQEFEGLVDIVRSLRARWLEGPSSPC